jgi:hypothetical protein
LLQVDLHPFTQVLFRMLKNRQFLAEEYSNSAKELSVRFEKEFAELMGAGFCAVTNSGTDALDAAQRSLDIGPGDEVITQTNTFVATAQTTFNLYALPVFVDSDPETFMIDADKIEERITANTRAILPVHIGGAAADMDKIMAIAGKHNLLVIEDACQAHMGEWRGKKLGTIGNLGCFSFQEGKSLCGGEGGAVIGNDDNLMARVDGYTNNGRDPRGQNRSFPGSNFRITPLYWDKYDVWRLRANFVMKIPATLKNCFRKLREFVLRKSTRARHAGLITNINLFTKRSILTGYLKQNSSRRCALKELDLEMELTLHCILILL